MNASLRSIRIGTLKSALGSVERNQDLGGVTMEFALAARDSWRRAIESKNQEHYIAARKECVRSAAMEIRAEIMILEAISDEVYFVATKDFPLSYWRIDPLALGHHAHARGIEGREWYERFDGFGAYSMAGGRGPGMGGWAWHRIGSSERLTHDERVAILGHDLDREQAAPQWAGPAEP